MLNRCGVLILIILMLIGCSHQKLDQLMSMRQKAANTVTQYRAIGAFNQVDIQGRLNVNLHTGYKQPQIVLNGDPRDLAQVKAQVSGHTLYLSLGAGFPKFGAVYADVRGQFLNRIRYVGAGYLVGTRLKTSVLDVDLANQGTTNLGGFIGLRTLKIYGNGYTQIHGISSQNLQVTLKGDPKVKLEGQANMSQLNIDGSAWFSFFWLKSNQLVIRSKKMAKIQLAGVVNLLDVELWGRSVFKGRYLRAERTFVKTHQHAIAEIASVHHQSSLATDASDIYYYNLPDTRADFMAFNGSVLDMRDWTQKAHHDFDRYNKQFP